MLHFIALIVSTAVIYIAGKPIVIAIDDYMKNHNVEEDIDE